MKSLPFLRKLAFIMFTVYSKTTMNHTDIKKIEDLSLNAWPSHQIQLYDGWILRFSHFYTYRTNCVEQFGSSELPPDTKIAYCEEVYRRWKTPCIFKITPLNRELMDHRLEAAGYEKRNPTTVMCTSLSGVSSSCFFPEVELRDRISDEWIDALFAIKGNATVTHLKIVPSMYAAIPKDVCRACIRDNGKIIATGLGILDREYIGIYAINVDPLYRRRGLAEKICRTLLYEGRKAGAAKAYLQVLQNNDPAVSLYKKLGFSHQYDYWFRLKELF